MSNLNISQFPAVTSADNSADLLLLWQGSSSTTKSISKLNYLGLNSAAVGLTDSQTLTNKVLTTPTISGPTLSGTILGTYTIGGTPTFPASVVTLTGSQTLTNKILTAPTINTATISNPTLTVDTVSGFSSASVGTVYGLSVNNGAITPTTVTASGLITASSGFTLSSGTLTLPNNTITAPMLATSAITLGYAQITSSFPTSSSSAVQVTGLTVTVTIPAGGRKVKITAWCDNLNGATTNSQMSIWDGTVGSGTRITNAVALTAAGTVTALGIVTPAAGSKTYNVGLLAAGGGTATLDASATSPAFILVEMI